MTPRVWNRRAGKEKPPLDAVYVGRPTRFGNPFSRPEHGRSRAEVIGKFEQWLLADPARIADVKATLRGKHLVCWCTPKPCHADVLLRIANE